MEQFQYITELPNSC